MTILSVQGVGKAFRHYHSEWHRFARWFGINTKSAEEHWVLRNISFDIHAGEAIGIVGENGAGKSTLLKVITGTLQPTEGRVQINGRVAAILELGMGFNPELTGRQNVYHAAGLMGFSVEQISQAMQDIEAFADIGEHFAETVRTYSTGMQVPVAFAVATAYRPEILIIDEALSVGDAGFGRKCFQRIEGYQNSGTTLLFVSHDIESVKKLCKRAIFLREGELVSIGAAKNVCDEYEKQLFGGSEATTGSIIQADASDDAPKQSMLDPSLVASCEMVYGNGKADIEYCWLEDLDGNRINVVESGISFRWRYRVTFNRAIENPIFAMMLKTRDGITLYGVDSTNYHSSAAAVAKGVRLDITFELTNSLAPGEYYLNCGVRSDSPEGIEFLSRRVDSSILSVVSSSNTTILTGMLEMGAHLSIESMQERTTEQI